MNNSTIAGIAIAIVLIAGGAWYWLASGPGNTAVTPTPTQAVDYKNATYRIEGQLITLVNGRAEVAVVPGSAETIVTQYFGNEATGDLNGDGVDDVAFILTQSTGGSGTFYYAVAAIKTDGAYRGTNAVLLGDRIAPQTTQISDGKLIVNYAVRNAGEPMTTAPSVGKSLYLKLDPTTLQFGEVVQNFEGEADPSKMTLTMQTWRWVKSQYNNSTTLTPKTPQVFTLALHADSTFAATTDCNSVSGTYAVKGATVTFGNMISTLKYCSGSQEALFTKDLVAAKGYLFTSKGELVITLKLDSGSMIFN